MDFFGLIEGYKLGGPHVDSMGLLDQIRSFSGSNGSYVSGWSDELYRPVTFDETMIEVEYESGDSWVGRMHYIGNTNNSDYLFSYYELNKDFFEDLRPALFYYDVDLRGDIINSKPGNSVETIVSDGSIKDINFKWTSTYVAVAKYKVYNAECKKESAFRSDSFFQDHVVMEKCEYENADVEEKFD